MARHKAWARFYGGLNGIDNWYYTSGTQWTMVNLAPGGASTDTCLRTMMDVSMVVNIPDVAAQLLTEVDLVSLAPIAYTAVLSSTDLTPPPIFSFGAADPRITATGELYLNTISRNGKDTGWLVHYKLLETIDSHAQRKDPGGVGYPVTAFYLHNLFDPGLMGTGRQVSFQTQCFARTLYEIGTP